MIPRRHLRLPFRAGSILVATLLSACGLPLAAQSANGLDMADRASAARTRGSDEAPIFVYEFANFQCAHCARFAIDIFPRIDSVFVQSGRVRWIFVNLPAPSMANAWAAHEAAACAGAVAGRFWAMHDVLFRQQRDWQDLEDARSAFERYARELNVPPTAFAACLDADRVASLLLQDVIFAASSRINGTPAFMVNDRQMVMGVKSFEEWKDILEKELSKTR